jgi:4-amino-4-deoxy-L-arabinose transferase-like glycosyltransferase
MWQPLVRWQLVVLIGILLAVQMLIMQMMPAQSWHMQADAEDFAHIMAPVEPIEYSTDPAYQGAYRWSLNVGVTRQFGRAWPMAQILSVDTHSGRPASSAISIALSHTSATHTFMLPNGWRRIHMLVFADGSDALYREVQWRINAEPISGDRRALGIVVRAITLADTNWAPSLWSGLVRCVYLGLLWLWVVLIGYWRRWPWWSALIVPCMLLLTLWLAPLHSALYLPSAWSALWLGYAMLALFMVPPIRVSSPQWWWGIALALGIVLLRFDIAWLGGLCLVVAWKLQGVLPPVPVATTEARSISASWLIAGIAVVAFVTRTMWLDDFPVGMFRDEARHGLLAQQIADGARFVYSSFADLPAGYFYLAALPVDWFGHTATSIRIVAALAGFGTVLALYWMMRDWLGGDWSLYASMFLATFLWHVGLSRIAWPATIGPLLTVIALGALWRGIQRQPLVWGAIAGLATGGMVYFYHSSRLLPLVVVIACWAFVRQSQRAWRPLWPLLGAWGVVALVVAMPMLSYALADVQVYMRRIGATSIMQFAADQGIPPWYAIMENLHSYLGMLVIRGDANPRHFNPGTPHLNGVEAFVFVVGLMTLWQRRDTATVVIGAWMLIGMLPGVLSVDAPHALRSVEMIVPITMVMALGAKVLLARVAHAKPHLIVPVYLLGAVLWGGFTYWQWQTHAKTLDAYDARITVVSNMIRAQRAVAPDVGVQWYVPKRWLNDDVVLYLLGRDGVASIDGVELSEPVVNQGIVVVHPSAKLPVGAIPVPLPPLLQPYVNSLKLACVGTCDQLTWLETVGR